MKKPRFVLISILLALIVLTYPTGQSKGYGNASGFVESPIKIRADSGGAESWLPIVSKPVALAPGAQTSTCHFGITIPVSMAGYDLSTIGVGSYLNWGFHAKNSAVADNIQYDRVVQVDDAGYATNLSELPALLAAYPGKVWIIGNEPDSEVVYQDHISAETYGQRFYEMAVLIRLNDPTAKIGFGSVIQPTPIRLHYLTLAINRMVQSAIADGKDQSYALGLIDFYSIHAFILNERPLTTPNCGDCWGAGVPVGYDASDPSWPAPEIIDGSQTFDISLFENRVVDFRQWMYDLGEQSKPLWITEYGSLFPTWLGVTELEAAIYMEQTFDYMLGTKNAALGNSNDEDRLVQKWLWYSLNDYVDHFGGSLYNPLTRQLTTVGEHFVSYDPSTTAVPITSQDVYVQVGDPVIGPGPLGYYTLNLYILNNVSGDRSTPVKVDLYLGSTPVGSFNVTMPRCGGRLPVSFLVNNMVAGENYTFTAQVGLTTAGQGDLDLSNNEITFQVNTPVQYYSMLPLVRR